MMDARRMIVAVGILLYTGWILANENIQITLDGSQYIEKPLIVRPTYGITSELSIIFKTSISSGLLFFASGITGDYIALELIRGKIRYVANSEGTSPTNPPVEIIYGENYADGRLHQVNVEIGEITKLYTYTVPEGPSNATSVRSSAKDLRYDLDEMIYYAGLPVNRRPQTRDILLSKSNYRGCLNVLTFNKEQLNISEAALKSKNSPITFKGKYITGCVENTPKFLKSFTSREDKLEVYSHANRNMFQSDFYYRTYLQNGNLLISRSPEKNSSVSLNLHKNILKLTVNVTKNDSITITHFDDNNDNGVWRRVRVSITPNHIRFSIDNSTTTYAFNRTIKLAFPYKTIIGGDDGRKNYFVGCIKDVYLGNELTSINKIMNLDLDIEYEETMCAMKDLCLPSKPCHNKGRCIQTATAATCNCDGTGYDGKYCQQEHSSKYKRSCTEYYNIGWRENGIFIIKPGRSKAFKVYCDMTNTAGPKTVVKTNAKPRSVFESKSYDSNFYYHQLTYSATKQQIADLIAGSQTCRQYVRYDCIASSLLNSYKTERSSSLGIRWYSRKGFPQKYWHGDKTTANRHSCRCGLDGNCLSPDVLCNCDVRDRNLHYDDGFISEKDDLPISKIRVSIQRTNPKSTFIIGNLECSDLLGSIQGTTTPYSNHTDIKESKTKSKNFVLINAKLLYGIIIAVVLLISILLVILILKRRICCCYYQNKAKPQIVEIYKDGELTTHRNNNRNNFQLSNDTSLNMDNVMVSLKRGMTTSFPVSCSDSSVSTIDPSRYYQHEAVESDPLNSIIPPEPPKRSILKIRKDLAQHPKRLSSESQHLHSSSSEASVAKSTGNIQTPPQQQTKLQYPLNQHHDIVFSKNFGGNSGSNDDGAKNSGIAPLKQKILEMSTSRQRLHSGELYFHHQDSSAIKSSTSSSSSRSTSKESDINTDLESSNDKSELIPSNKCQRSRSVRFSEEEKRAFYAHMYRNSPLTVNKQQGKRTTVSSEYDDQGYLFGDDAGKTLV